MFLLKDGHTIVNDVLIVTETLHKRDVQEILEKFHPLGMFDSSKKNFGTELGGATAEIMSDILAFEANKRAVNITINRASICLV
uniref:Uncharacterized protein n=1 Tax=Lactuca sativa TaxID=4236 RepID=A0A9R1X956_LACSA|nr:hypothetical protein LSAT_V11C500264330 [Lactuca sativa]